jgi:8-oxo-dGTP pyrophosphatase MutT (NUDIX family)
MSSEFEQTGSQTLFDGKFFDVQRNTYRHEDGEEVQRDIVVHDGAVGVVAHDGEQIYLVRQPREAIGVPDLLEIPAGKLDEEGESPLDTAKRELAEEIGKAASDWEHLVSFYTSPGFTNEQCHLYLATGLSDASAEVQENERIEVCAYPLSDLDRLIDESKDSKTLVGLLLLRQRLQ